MQAKALEEAQRKAAEEVRTREHEESRLPPLNLGLCLRLDPRLEYGLEDHKGVESFSSGGSR